MDSVTETIMVDVRLRPGMKYLLLLVNSLRLAVGLDIWVPRWALIVGKPYGGLPQ